MGLQITHFDKSNAQPNEIQRRKLVKMKILLNLFYLDVMRSIPVDISIHVIWLLLSDVLRFFFKLNPLMVKDLTITNEYSICGSKKHTTHKHTH